MASAAAGPRAMTRPDGVADKRLAREGHRRFLADTIGQRGEVAVLERRHPEFRFVQTVGPLADHPRLGHHDHVGPLQAETAHHLRVVPVVADRDTNPASRGLVHRHAVVAGGVVVLLVEVRHLRDVQHARAAEQAAVGVNDRRAVERTVALTFVQVQDNHGAELGGQPGEGRRGWSGHGFGEFERRRAAARTAREERREGQFGKRHERSATGRRFPDGLESTSHVDGVVRTRLMLDERDAHGATPHPATGTARPRYAPSPGPAGPGQSGTAGQARISAP